MDDEARHVGRSRGVRRLRAAALLDLPCHIVGIVAAAQNMPDGNAYVPGDIIRSAHGKTIEVLNTDAEAGSSCPTRSTTRRASSPTRSSISRRSRARVWSRRRRGVPCWQRREAIAKLRAAADTAQTPGHCHSGSTRRPSRARSATS
jgi:hypothetical protein